MPPPRRGRPALVVAAVVVLAAVILGVVVAMHSTSSSGRSQLQQVTAFIDRVPLPPGSTMIDEHATPEHGAATAHIERSFRLPAGPQTAAIRAALEKAGWHVVPASLDQSPADVWTRDTDATSGDIYVAPPGEGAKGGSAEMRWDTTGLTVDLGYEDLPHANG